MPKRRICFVSGTRAEFGLMHGTLRAIKAHPDLTLQIIVTGNHLSPHHGRGVEVLRAEGWRIDAVVDWPTAGGDLMQLAKSTALAMSGLADAFLTLKSDVVLVVGDRVEAFAAASAAHLMHLPVAHVHGGDRALGQVDDSLRHVISRLSHLHFPATEQSARRLVRMGEDRWRIRRVGSPGLDGVVEAAEDWSRTCRAVWGMERGRPGGFGLLVLHPAQADAGLEYSRAGGVLKGMFGGGLSEVVIIHPNNDPGAEGILRAWREAGRDSRVVKVLADVPRGVFLSLMKRAVLMAGNSSAGIIEAASFGTPVLNVGPRQMGREHSKNVIHVGYAEAVVARAVRRIWNQGKPKHSKVKNVYGGGRTGSKIASALASLKISPRLLSKLIAY